LMRDVLVAMARRTFEEGCPSFSRLCPSSRPGQCKKCLEKDFILMIMWLLRTLKESRTSDRPLSTVCADISNLFLMFDDAWLDTMLKSANSKIEMLDDIRYKDMLPNRKLKTIVTNNEEYTSIIKRYDDFWIFDDVLYQKLFESGDFQRLYKKACGHYDSLSEEEKRFKASQKLKSILDAIHPEPIIPSSELGARSSERSKPLPTFPDYNVWRAPTKHLLFNRFRNVVYKGSRQGQWIREFVEYYADVCLRKDKENRLRKLERHYADKLTIKTDDELLSILRKKIRNDVIIGEIKMKHGINDDLILVRRRDPNGQWTFDEMSELKAYLEAEEALIPSFHLYCHREDADPQEVQDTLIKFVKEKIFKFIEDLLPKPKNYNERL